MRQYLKILFVVLAALIISNNNFAQAEKINVAGLTGNLSMDSRIILENFNKGELTSLKFELTEKKSPVTAGVLSLVLPGAGQFYNGSIVKSIIFIAIEAAVITTAVIYTKKANDKTTEFQNFADQNWDV